MKAVIELDADTVPGAYTADQTRSPQQHLRRPPCGSMGAPHGDVPGGASPVSLSRTAERRERHDIRGAALSAPRVGPAAGGTERKLPERRLSLKPAAPRRPATAHLAQFDGLI